MPQQQTMDDNNLSHATQFTTCHAYGAFISLACAYFCVDNVQDFVNLRRHFFFTPLTRFFHVWIWSTYIAFPAPGGCVTRGKRPPLPKLKSTHHTSHALYTTFMFGRQAFQHLAAVRRGEVREAPEEEPPSPRWTPYPGSPLLNRLRKAMQLEMGPFSIAVYTIIFLNALVLCLDHAGASSETETALAGVRVPSFL